MSIAFGDRKRFTLKMILFVGVMLVIFGWPYATYLFIKFGPPAKQGEYFEVDLKAMGFFEMDPRTATIDAVPKIYRDLDGKKVVLQGEIYQPIALYGKMTGFTLVYELGKRASFHGPPKIQEAVFATVNENANIKYEGTGYDYNVYGTLHVTMKRDALINEIIEVYHLDVDKVEPHSNVD